MLAFAGGILGVLMMVPLRRALIVKEHGVLPYPEGAACADVLIAGERGGKLASMVFAGVGIGALWKALSWVFNLFAKELDYSTPRGSQFPNATLNVDISPEYWASATSSVRGSPARCSPAACCRGWCCCRC